jgi:hypothetical protein
MARIRPLGASRRRTGATDWRVEQVAETPDVWLERWSLPNWSDYTEQISARRTAYDAELAARVAELSTKAPVVRHLLPPGALGRTGEAR